MKNFALRFLAAGLTFCFGLTSTGLYRAYVAYHQHKLLIERENKLQRESLMREHEIESLLNKLLPSKTAEGDPTDIWCSNQAELQVRDRLLQMASESWQARLQVIAALLRTFEKPALDEECPLFAARWRAAVFMLGDLKATEAIDILVRNLCETHSIFVSLGDRSPAWTAIVKIGEPAVPRLIEALSDENRGIRYEAAEALAKIGRATGQPAVIKLKDALRHGNAETKVGAALALTWIGGEEANAAIEQVIKEETDPATLSKLKDPLKAMRLY